MTSKTSLSMVDPTSGAQDVFDRQDMPNQEVTFLEEPNLGQTSRLAKTDFNNVKEQILEQIHSELKGKTVEEARSFQPPYSDKNMSASLPKTFKC